jgi:hypothetical protein
MKLFFSLAYLAAIVVIAALYVPLSMLAALVLALLISLLSTLADEAAEKGATDFRGKETWQRMCVNIHWALFAFYLTVIRVSLSLPSVPNVVLLALILAALSLLTGSSGSLVIRRFKSGGALMAFFSLPMAIAFSIFATQRGFKM